MQPLEGLIVIEIARLLPAPFVGTILRDLGATVVKVEFLPRGDSLRGTELFTLLNRGKYSVALEAEKLHEALSKLLPQAQVLLTNYRPQTQTEMGLIPSVLLQKHPHLVYVNLTGFSDGRPGHDLNFLAESGALDRLRPAPEASPIVPGFLVGDLLGGTASALIRLLAALYHQKQSGKGAYISVAMREEILRWSIASAHLYRLFSGTLPPPSMDFLSGGMPSYRLYRTADNRYLAVAAIEEKFWKELCEFLGRPDLIPYGRSISDPFPHAEMEKIFASATWAEWKERLQETQFCVSPVYTFEEALQMPWASQIWQEGFLTFSPETSLQVPALGEHNEWARQRFGI
ncbi:MAG: CaiB/BaiF CoA-transferase family protein [Bacteroidia bacterium]|nr:CoA transferase [Bacteroidia bacterium]MDW8015126.1 CaiB/BaiF CoA-transferase family protein [Bacteroidia bacterium]